MLTYRNDPAVRRWLIRATVDPATFKEKWLESVVDPYDHSCAALVGDELIGTGMLEVVDGMGQDDDPATHKVEGLLGYILDPAQAGQGYATELAHDLLSLAFDRLGLRRVTAGCYADNIASRRVLEKVGMRLEQYGVRDSWHSELGWIDGCTTGSFGRSGAQRTQVKERASGSEWKAARNSAASAMPSRCAGVRSTSGRIVTSARVASTLRLNVPTSCPSTTTTPPAASETSRDRSASWLRRGNPVLG